VNLITLYTSARFCASTPTTVEVEGRQYVGIRFSNSNLTGYVQTDSRRRTLSFYYTQHNARNGIWVPKPTNATSRIIGLIGSRGELILANGQRPVLSRNGLTFFVRGGVNSTHN
jgi:hypothetical protein